MKVTGQISVKAPRDRVFEAIQDAEFFASCIDGVRDLTEVDETHYTAVMETKIAYIKFRFDIEVELSRIEPPHFIEARAVGTPAGVVGRLTATATNELREEGDETILDYAVDATLTGKLGSIGQPVLKAKARDMEQEFTKRLRAAFAETTTAGEAPAEPRVAHDEAKQGFFGRIWLALLGFVRRLGGASARDDGGRGMR